LLGSPGLSRISASPALVPLLQIDTHGDGDGIGPSVENGLRWQELTTALTPLNQATGSQLEDAFRAAHASDAELRGFAQATYQRTQGIVKTAGWFRRSPSLESYRTANVSLARVSHARRLEETKEGRYHDML
jgi:hypothetical protein